MPYAATCVVGCRSHFVLSEANEVNRDLYGKRVTYSNGHGGSLLVACVDPMPLLEFVDALLEWPEVCSRVASGGS
jgi:hypothetical protein